MNEGVIPISWWGIALSLLPLALVGWIYHRHNRKGGLVIYATARMLGQLLLMGFVLVLILEIESPYMVIPVVDAFFRRRPRIPAGDDDRPDYRRYRSPAGDPLTNCGHGHDLWKRGASRSRFFCVGKRHRSRPPTSGLIRGLLEAGRALAQFPSAVISGVGDHRPEHGHQRGGAKGYE